MSTTYTPSNRIGWWGGLDTRLRCTRTDKVVFIEQVDAESAARKIREREGAKPHKGGYVMQAYQCKDCSYWHVGHGKK